MTQRKANDATQGKSAGAGRPVADKTHADAQTKLDDKGLQPDSEHEYRGRESYEQQRDEGQGGRSGIWEQTDDADRSDPPAVGPRQERTSGKRHPDRT